MLATEAGCGVGGDDDARWLVVFGPARKATICRGDCSWNPAAEKMPCHVNVSDSPAESAGQTEELWDLVAGQGFTHGLAWVGRDVLVALPKV
ncbi:hypothetical protein HPP92_025321 [Vanilla planifolia]|uniref:Uncharacterized protein n=1 Tax=Vanilla planifolia TaxID=51239 RepID=A0A835PPU9_VANPL|nr:hypothetical protein HPP92_025321 [Vanilla planifolia]